jgi:hypothetical protein
VAPFIIYTNGRSRTAWLSQFLSYDGWTCHHERAIYMREVADVREFFASPRTGTVETAASFGWQIVKHHVPGIRMVVVFRPVEDVVQSMLRMDVGGLFRYDEDALRGMISRCNRVLERIAAAPGVLRLDYCDLDTEEGCGRVFKACLGVDMPSDRWREFSARNIQVNAADILIYYHQNRDAVEGFKRACKRELRNIAAQRLRGAA